MKEVKICLKDVFDYASEIANERHEQKKSFKTHLPLSDNYELVGVLGEFVFSLLIQERMDTELKVNGDDGFDFQNINIKSSEEHKAKHLIEFIDKDFNGWYVFVIINLTERYGYVKGYIHSSDFKRKAKTVDFGYGERLALSLDQLKPYRQRKTLVLNNIYSERQSA